ncbi:MAG: class I SAM-dependent methyltransferase [Chitinophagales bacterium]
MKSLYHGMVADDRKKFVENKYGFKNGLPEIDIRDMFSEFNETVYPFSHLYGTSLPIDLAIIKKLAKQFDNCEYLEIGSWRGESLANLSPVCKRCVSISLPDEQMRKLGFSEKSISMQRFFSKDLANVEHIGADSTTFDFSKLGKFDVIFVDGDHRFEAVKSDTENVFKLLRNENSVIVWHDYTEHYELIDWEVFAGILAGTPKNVHSNLYHIKNSLCAIYTRNKIKSSLMDFPARPNKDFEIIISIIKNYA